MQHLDKQMILWASRLRDDLSLTSAATNTLASTIFAEVRSLSPEARRQVMSGERISLKSRIDELVAFQAFMDGVGREHGPEIVRAQVVIQNYVCFAYLGESCFKAIVKAVPSDSATRKCCRFLTDNPVRAFRNALAHANWEYKPDFSGLVFWARKGSGPDEPLCRFEVLQQDLNFWQALARCVGYAAFLALQDEGLAPNDG